MKLDRDRFLAAALAMSTTLVGCKLGSLGDDTAAQAAPENAPATPGAGSPAESPAGGPGGPVGREDERGRGDFVGGTRSGEPRSVSAQGNTATSSGLVAGSKGLSPTKEVATSPTKEVATSPTKEVATSPTREVATSPTKETYPSPAKETYPSPTKEKVPTPTKEL